MTFNETGLPYGATWTVDLAGSNQTLSGQIPYLAANGTYHYSIAPVPNFRIAMPSGVISVNGHDTGANVTFHSELYVVEFLSSGLPAETRWTVTLNGTNASSKAPWVQFALINGTYNFTVWAPVGFHSNVTNGAVGLAGAMQTVLVQFEENSTAPPGTPTNLYVEAALGGLAGAAAAGGAAVYWRGRSRNRS